jgi:hypothetical protein
VSKYLLPGEGHEIAAKSVEMAISNGRVLLIEAGKVSMIRPRPDSDTPGQGAALAAAARGWIEMAETIASLSEKGIHVDLEGSQG